MDFKEDAKTDPNSDRPISVLPVVSKLVESSIYEYLTLYMNI